MQSLEDFEYDVLESREQITPNVLRGARGINVEGHQGCVKDRVIQTGLGGFVQHCVNAHLRPRGLRKVHMH